MVKIKLMQSKKILPNSTIIQYAHIYPVKEIRKSFFNENEKINLNDISNADNFLPLAAEIHQLYDSDKLFWNQNGELELLEEALKYNEYYKNTFGIYSKISNNILINTKIGYYLKILSDLKKF